MPSAVDLIIEESEDTWLQDGHAAKRASLMARAFDALSAIDADAGSRFFDEWCDVVNQELAATDILDGYVLDDFSIGVPRENQEMGAENHQQRLDRIESEAKEKWVNKEIERKAERDGGFND